MKGTARLVPCGHVVGVPLLCLLKCYLANTYANIASTLSNTEYWAHTVELNQHNRYHVTPTGSQTLLEAGTNRQHSFTETELI